MSTALAALLTEANAGVTPASQATIDALSLRVSPDLMADLATAIQLVAEHGVPLPAGVADTGALAFSPSTSSVLADFIAEQSDPTNADLSQRYQTARSEALTEAAVPMAAPAATAAKTLAYFTAFSDVPAVGMVVSYRADGTVIVSRPDGARMAVWSTVGDTLQITLPQPYSVQLAVIDPDTQQIWEYSLNTWGFAIKRVSDTVAVMETQQTQTWTSGPNLGQTITLPTGGGSVVKAVDPGTTPALTAGEFAVGASWGGVLVGTLDEPDADVMDINGPSAAHLRRTGQDFAWSIVDGWLSSAQSPDSYERRYRRLWVDAASGEEHWLVVDFNFGVMMSSTEVIVVRVTTGLAFVADSHLYRRWQSGLSSSLVEEIYSDGTSLDMGAALWTLDPSGMLMQTRTDATDLGHHRDWILLRSTPNQIFVLEHVYFDDGSFDNWRTNVYTDLGPSGH